MTAIDELDNWLSPTMLADPYAIYQQLRERDPVHWNPQTHAWVLTRHADVAAALQDRRLSSVPTAGPRFSRPLHPDEYASIGAVVPYLMMFMQGMDPPLHTRQRALVHRTFTPRTIERLRPRTEALVAAALDRASTTGTIELMAELAGTRDRLREHGSDGGRAGSGGCDHHVLLGWKGSSGVGRGYPRPFRTLPAPRLGSLTG